MVKEIFVSNECPYCNFLGTYITQSNKNALIKFGIKKTFINEGVIENNVQEEAVIKNK